ncbi:MAG: hypothetical protein ACRDRU_10300 [Pseudonocardiaceae bacterium]
MLLDLLVCRRVWPSSPLRGGTGGCRWLALCGHERHVVAVAFSPDRHTLATASLDGKVRLWTSRTAVTPQCQWQPRRYRHAVGPH